MATPWESTPNTTARTRLPIGAKCVSLETNENRFDRNTGFGNADDFARYMTDTFDVMYEESAEAPKLMSIGLHDRLIGRPSKAVSSVFWNTPRGRDRAWFCTGRDGAEHWHRLRSPKEGSAS